MYLGYAREAYELGAQFVELVLVLEVDFFDVFFADGRELLFEGFLDVASLDDVEGVGAENSVDFLFDGPVLVLLEHFSKNLRDEVDERFEEVLVPIHVVVGAFDEDDLAVDFRDIGELLVNFFGFTAEELGLEAVPFLALGLEDPLLLLEAGNLGAVIVNSDE